MKLRLTAAAAPATALVALAFVTMATPASAAGDYCRRDVTSYMTSCGITLEQCQSMSAGRGGDCYRDPSAADNSNALAYAPKVQAKPGKHHVKTPTEY
jgi:hypothetical protein